LHQDTDEFCEQTLSSSDVLNAIRDGYCFWGGSVEYPEPYMLMNEHIKPSAFPSLSVRVLYIIYKYITMQYQNIKITNFASF
jgi:hypothetical protein